MLTELIGFVTQMSPQIGIVATLIAVFVLSIIVYIFNLNKQKDEIIKKLFDRLENQAEESNKILGSTMKEIKDGTTQTTKEISGLSIQIGTIVDLVKVLLYTNIGEGTKETDIKDDDSDSTKKKPSVKKKGGGTK